MRLIACCVVFHAYLTCVLSLANRFNAGAQLAKMKHSIANAQITQPVYHQPKVEPPKPSLEPMPKAPKVTHRFIRSKLTPQDLVVELHCKELHADRDSWLFFKEISLKQTKWTIPDIQNALQRGGIVAELVRTELDHQLCKVIYGSGLGMPALIKSIPKRLGPFRSLKTNKMQLGYKLDWESSISAMDKGKLTATKGQHPLPSLDVLDIHRELDTCSQKTSSDILELLQKDEAVRLVEIVRRVDSYLASCGLLVDLEQWKEIQVTCDANADITNEAAMEINPSVKKVSSKGSCCYDARAGIVIFPSHELPAVNQTERAMMAFEFQPLAFHLDGFASTVHIPQEAELFAGIAAFVLGSLFLHRSVAHFVKSTGLSEQAVREKLGNVSLVVLTDSGYLLEHMDPSAGGILQSTLTKVIQLAMRITGDDRSGGPVGCRSTHGLTHPERRDILLKR